MLITNQRIDKLTAARTFFTSQGMLSGSLSSMADALLGIFSSMHESQANDITHGPSAQPILSHNHENLHATLNEHSCQDSRPEDDPEVGVEISLAKTYGTHGISLFL